MNMYFHYNKDFISYLLVKINIMEGDSMLF